MTEFLIHMWGSSIDITDVYTMQDELKRSYVELAKKQAAFKEKNIALKELISQIASDRKEFKDKIMHNVKYVILPSLEKIRLRKGAQHHVDQHRKSLEDLAFSFGRELAGIRMQLTSREIEVCRLVGNGLTNKEISQILYIAQKTVAKHRRMARKNLGLNNKSINLRTYLESL